MTKLTQAQMKLLKSKLEQEQVVYRDLLEAYYLAVEDDKPLKDIDQLAKDCDFMAETIKATNAKIISLY